MTKATKSESIIIKVDPNCPPGEAWLIAADSDRMFYETDKQYQKKIAQRTCRIFNVR